MANEVDDYLHGDELDLLFETLDYEEFDDDLNLQQEFADAVEEIQPGKFVCGSCKKVCKSKGGLTRHQTAVHGTMTNIAQTSTTEPELKLAEDYIMQVIQEAKKILENDMCYPSHIREEFSKLNGQNLDPEFIKVSQKLYRSFYKNADAEKFYTNFFSEIPLKSSHFFPTINKHAAMLLVLKFADCLVAFEKRRTACVTKKTQDANYNKLSDHEENALQYLSGYVLHNLYKKITNSKSYNTDRSQQALSFIKSARSVTNFTSQRLVNALNRGGLWFATETAQGIFQQTEYAFQEETSGQEVNKTDCPALIIKLLNSVDIKAKFNLLLGECDMEVDEKVGLDTLQQMISLYLRVRSFSFAKDIVEKCKKTAAKTKTKALRKEIKKSSNGVRCAP